MDWLPPSTLGGWGTGDYRVPPTASLGRGPGRLFCNKCIRGREVRLGAEGIIQSGLSSAGSWESFQFGALEGLDASVQGQDSGRQTLPPLHLVSSPGSSISVNRSLKQLG